MSEPKLLTNPSELRIDELSKAKRDGQKLLFPIRIEAPEGQDVHIRLLNLLGKPVLQQNIRSEEAARGKSQIDLGKVPLGVYFLSAEAGSAKSLVKLTITEEGAKITPPGSKGSVQSQKNNALRFEGSILRVSCPSLAEIRIYNMLGHQVGALTVRGKTDYDVNKWDLPEGVYLVKMRAKEGPEYAAKITISR